MIDEEKLAEYLDNTLDPSAKASLEADIQQDPSLAAELEEMAKVGSILKKSGTDYRSILASISTSGSGAGFFEGVRSGVLQQMASDQAGTMLAAGTVAANSKVAGLLAAASTKITGMVLGAAIGVTGIVMGVNYLTSPDPTSIGLTAIQSQGALPQQTQVMSAPVDQMKVAPQAVPAQSQNKPIIEKTRPNRSISEPSQTVIATGKAELGGRITEADSQTEKDIAQYREQARLAQSKGDRIAEAFASKKVGILLRQQSDFQASLETLRGALKLADELRLHELRSSLHGEIGLTLRRAGDLEGASSEIQQAVEIGKAHGSAVDRWEKELRKR